MASSKTLEKVDEKKEQESDKKSTAPPIPKKMSSIPSFGTIASFMNKEHFHDKCYLFYCPTMAKIAKQLADKSKGSIILGNIQWNKFKDGFPDLKIHDANNLRWAHVAFLADLSDPLNIFEQYAIMCALPRLLARSVKIFVGYFPTGTMERVEEYGRIATAKTLARILSSIPIGAHGPVQLCICDLHTLQNHFYFSDNVLVRLETCIGLIKHQLQKVEHCTVAFPDEGAHKRFNKFFKKYPQIICIKTREGDQRIVKIREGIAENRNVVIIDDLVQTGGTLAECAKVIKNNKCKSVSCYCTHSVFPLESWKRFTKNGKDAGLFEKFWITDTIPTISDELAKHEPYKVLNTAHIFYPIITDSDDVIAIEH